MKYLQTHTLRQRSRAAANSTLASVFLKKKTERQAAKRQAVKKLSQKLKVFGYLLDKNFIQPNLRGLFLVFSHSAVSCNALGPPLT